MRREVEGHPDVAVVPASNREHAGELCVRDGVGHLDFALFRYMPRMAGEKHGQGSVLAITNGNRDKWWHHKVAGLWYDEATDVTFIGVNKPFPEVVALFLEKKGYFPTVEIKAPPPAVSDWIAKHGKGQGPILLYDPTKPTARHTTLRSSAAAKQAAPTAALPPTKSPKHAKSET